MTGPARTIRNLPALSVAVTLIGAAVVVGAVWSNRAADAAATTTHRITIPAAAFYPNRDVNSYTNTGDALKGSGWFLAPIPFHRPGTKVQVLDMTMFVMDNDSTLEHDACVSLIRTIPAGGTESVMAQTCTAGESPSVRAFRVRVPVPRSISESRGGYVKLAIYGNTDDLLFHGVRITYKVIE